MRSVVVPLMKLRRDCSSSAAGSSEDSGSEAFSPRIPLSAAQVVRLHPRVDERTRGGLAEKDRSRRLLARPQMVAVGASASCARAAAPHHSARLPALRHGAGWLWLLIDGVLTSVAAAGTGASATARGTLASATGAVACETSRSTATGCLGAWNLQVGSRGGCPQTGILRTGWAPAASWAGRLPAAAAGWTAVASTIAGELRRCLADGCCLHRCPGIAATAWRTAYLHRCPGDCRHCLADGCCLHRCPGDCRHCLADGCYSTAAGDCRRCLAGGHCLCQACLHGGGRYPGGRFGPGGR